jgi:hypothetical protein
VTCEGARKGRLTMRIQFLVESRRYTSIFDVMRDRYGIKQRPEGVTTLRWDGQAMRP